MHDPIRQALASMEADADRVVLADPATLRRIGSRRTRFKVGATVVAAGLAVLVGGYLAVGRPPAPQPMPLPPAQTASPTPAATPSASASTSAAPEQPDPSDPPGPPDPCDTQPAMCVPPALNYYWERLPAPCTTTSNPSDAQIVARHSGLGSSYYDLDRQEGATMFTETRTRYAGSGAAGYLAEVRQAVARCPSVQRRRGETDSRNVTLRYRQVSVNSLGGDESVLLSRTFDSATYLIAVIRFGDVVLVVMDHGWEGSASLRKTYDTFLAEAVERARSWNP